MSEPLGSAEIETRWAQEADTLRRLRDRWVRYARTMNLTGAGDEAAIEAHMREGVGAVIAAETAFGAELGRDVLWLDVGSGGGFPGLLVAALTDCQLVMVEPRARRAAFLEASVAWLGRGQVRVVRGRVGAEGWSRGARVAEDVPKPGQYHVAGARAVMEPRAWGRCARAWIRPGGLGLFHLGAGQEVPQGWDEAARAEVASWSVVAARVGA